MRETGISRQPSSLTREAFLACFGGVFEHSPWIAERAFDAGISAQEDTAGGLHDALVTAFRASSAQERLTVLRAHPDLAGKLAIAKRLTADSTSEQASAGLDALTDAERARFAKLNAAYTSRFGFPFILAVKGRGKADILAVFQTRVENDRDTEFVTACAEVERIALLRLRDLLPDS